MGKQRRQLPQEIYMVSKLRGGGQIWAAMLLGHPPGVAAPIYSYRASAGEGTLVGLIGRSSEVSAAEDEVLRRVLAHLGLGGVDAVDAGPHECPDGRAEKDDQGEHE